jgi:mRNA interferase MazF
MPIQFHPKPGTVLICDYETGFIQPEMVKKRRVIVVSSYQSNKHGLCTVVPLSTTAPNPIRPFHYCIPKGTYSFLHTEKDCWVKSDMISRVGFGRLDRLRVGNRFMSPQITEIDLAAVRRAIAYTIDF